MSQMGVREEVEEEVEEADLLGGRTSIVNLIVV